MKLLTAIRTSVAAPFLAAGCLIWGIAGIVGFIVCLNIVYVVLGFWGIVLGFFLFPLFLLAAPWYALFAWGNLIPVLLVYGCGILAWIVFGIGYLIKGE